MDALSCSAASQLEHYSILGGPIPPFHLGPTFQGLLEWTGACHVLSLLQTFIFSPWNDLISAPCQACYSPRSKANTTTNNHFFRVLAMQGLTVEANVMVCEDDRSVPLGCAPHGDMNHSESCLNVMFLQREKKEPQCYMCYLHRGP